MRRWAGISFQAVGPEEPKECSPMLAMQDTLHWLSFPQRVTFKLCLLAYKCLHGLALTDYLSRFCTLLTSVPGRPLLRSADANKLLVPRSCTASFGLRSFSSSGPTAWNDMPAPLCNLDLSLSDFRQLLKTVLFQTSGVVTVRAFVTVNLLIERFEINEMSVYYYYYYLLAICLVYPVLDPGGSKNTLLCWCRKSQLSEDLRRKHSKPSDRRPAQHSTGIYTICCALKTLQSCVLCTVCAQVFGIYTAISQKQAAVAVQSSTGVVCVNAAVMTILTASSHTFVTNYIELTTWLPTYLLLFIY